MGKQGKACPFPSSCSITHYHHNLLSIPSSHCWYLWIFMLVIMTSHVTRTRNMSSNASRICFYVHEVLWSMDFELLLMSSHALPVSWTICRSYMCGLQSKGSTRCHARIQYAERHLDIAACLREHKPQGCNCLRGTVDTQKASVPLGIPLLMCQPLFLSNLNISVQQHTFPLCSISWLDQSSFPQTCLSMSCLWSRMHTFAWLRQLLTTLVVHFGLYFSELTALKNYLESWGLWLGMIQIWIDTAHLSSWEHDRSCKHSGKISRVGLLSLATETSSNYMGFKGDSIQC